MSTDLTQTQQEILALIAERIETEGMPPSQWKPGNAGSRNQRLSSAA